MTAPGEDENHASIRLDQPTDESEIAVDERGEITAGGVLHKHATMVDVSVGHVTTSDFSIGPPPEKVSAWASSWETSLRPPQLGENLVCTRAEREPKRNARILRSVTVVDLLPPSNVPDLAVGDVTDTTAKVTWGEATDNYGLAGYEVTVDGGEPQRTSIGTRSHAITGLEPQTDHTVSVVAVDIAGNTSKTPATASFTTLAPPEPPDPDAELKFEPEQGGALATWAPNVDADVMYRTKLDGEELEEFSPEQYCQGADGEPADPCTAESVIGYPLADLEEVTSYSFEVEELAADGTVARSFTGDFTTTASEPEVPAATTEKVASESSQCAGRGGDFYVAPGARSGVAIPAGSTELFSGCYTAADSSCIDAYLPVDGEKVMDCSDDVTELLYDVAPPGRGPVIATVGSSGAASIDPFTWCTEGACAVVLAPAQEAVKVVAKAAPAAATTPWLVVTLAGIGIGLVLWAILAVLFPTPIGIYGLLEYPIQYTDDFDTYEDWHLDEGEWFNSLKVYAEVIKTTNTVAARDNLFFGWDSAKDSNLKRIIDAACTAQRGQTDGVAGCDDNVAVYVPGGKNYTGKPMQQTGKHIIAALGDGGWPQPPERLQWLYPRRSQGGKMAQAFGYDRSWYDKDPSFQPNVCNGRAAGTVCDEFPFWTTNQAVDLSGETADLKPVPKAESLPQGSDISGFFRKCDVADAKDFIVLPVKPWVEAEGPSFGFRVSSGSASMCMSPK